MTLFMKKLGNGLRLAHLNKMHLKHTNKIAHETYHSFRGKKSPSYKLELRRMRDKP